MSAPAPSRRTVDLVVGAVLVVVGAVIASIAVFGGSTAPDPEPSRPPTSQPSEPTTEPTPNECCVLYDHECQTGGNGSFDETPQPCTPPGGGGSTSGNRTEHHMQPVVLQAIDAWEQHWSETQDAAVDALKTAFPRLHDCPRYVGCDDIRLEYEEDGHGGGRVCVDNEGRANVEFGQVPNEVIARAIDEVQFPYLDDADGSLSDAPPGTYVYECETSAAQFEFTLGSRGHGQVVISFATIPDAAAVLDALARASDEDAT